MKTIAMYLPQFHRVKENDMWWGEGFTDWVSTKKANPLFENHYQPHIPLNDNYYDLLSTEVLKWQADLMKQYNIDGVCMYHYWFKDGRRILEKPAELLLCSKSIDMSFCFCWANETWARSWANVQINMGKNVWSNVEEPQKDLDNVSNRGILLEQIYGDREQWAEHFYYLLPFFKDDRYIYKDNKPVLLIYNTDSVHCLEDMLQLWDELARANGLQGVYIIGGFNEKNKKCIDANYIPAPWCALESLGAYTHNGICRLQYEDVWEKCLQVQVERDNVIYGSFPGYDDSPRRGKEGIVIEGANPTKFQYYLAHTMAKNAVANQDITFINAWNEWGEGMHLEPDEKYGYGFLEAVQNAKKEYFVYIDEYVKKFSVKTEQKKQSEKKFEQYANLMDYWMTLRENGISLETYFVQNGYFKVAIYGCGILGRHLIKELQESSINIAYLIDRSAEHVHQEIEVYTPSQMLPECDAIVITPFCDIEEIRKVLPKSMKMISIETVIRETTVDERKR